ncbi:hypothetical protein [Serratia fonticola]|uniref:lipopolysaccharide biosynthesis protein n=1 Tax=Serratia fonticola TaxID=47917 RepID=UPI00301D5577
MINRIASIILRGGTLASKFVLIVFLARYLSLDELGIYALVVASVSYCLYLLGMDFYTFSSRDILSDKKIHWKEKIKDQFSFYAIIYIVTISIAAYIYLLKIIPDEIVIFGVAVLIADHFSQELMRIMVIMGKPNEANIQLFIRTGGGSFFAIGFMWLANIYSLSVVFTFWLLGDILAILFSIFVLRRENIGDIKTYKINWLWILNGLKICTPLLISTLANRGVYTVDRYFVSHYSGVEMVGIYSYYSSFSGALLAFVDAGVIIYFYPKLISAFNNKERVEYRRIVRAFYKAIALVCLAVSIGLLAFIPTLTKYVGKNQFLDSIPLFYLLLLSMVIYCFSLVCHYELYAMRKDKQLIASAVISFVVAIICMPILGYFYGGYGVAGGQLIAITVLSVVKFVFLKAGKRRVIENDILF